MLWTPQHQFHPDPFEKEAELEVVIREVKATLFGENRIYVDVKKLIGERGKTQNIPDGYLLDFSSPKRPVLYLVEVELAKHDPLRHIAQQLLNFFLSFKSTPQRMKQILTEHLLKNPEAMRQCEDYALKNGFRNLDYLLEQMIYSEQAFNCLVIIDELEDELESILHSSLGFPVETLTVQRYQSEQGGVVYQFEPFLYDLSSQSATTVPDKGNTPAIDPAEIDTVVVPAREDGFQETFLGENRWYAIRIHSSMLPKIRYIATYRVAPVSAITHVAEVSKIEPWKDTGKYVLDFKESAKAMTPIPLVPGGRIMAPQAPRYTSFARLQKAKSLDEVF
ncbi:hypothetical protein [Roseimicrobium sp. ORNL1]|uniref:hypothetical protein n=1 Tax=Roseimicrobium sp. ORNL1 TaxID=2711231 RepID=UPI001981E621|nr:hypothetical protein [Roseimicrobium sp. ORNL1]